MPLCDAPPRPAFKFATSQGGDGTALGARSEERYQDLSKLTQASYSPGRNRAPVWHAHHASKLTEASYSGDATARYARAHPAHASLTTLSCAR
jgi:hypothetical protein